MKKNRILVRFVMRARIARKDRVRVQHALETRVVREKLRGVVILVTPSTRKVEGVKHQHHCVLQVGIVYMGVVKMIAENVLQDQTVQPMFLNVRLVLLPSIVKKDRVRVHNALETRVVWKDLGGVVMLGILKTITTTTQPR